MPALLPARVRVCVTAGCAAFEYIDREVRSCPRSAQIQSVCRPALAAYLRCRCDICDVSVRQPPLRNAHGTAIFPQRGRRLATDENGVASVAEMQQAETDVGTRARWRSRMRSRSVAQDVRDTLAAIRNG